MWVSEVLCFCLEVTSAGLNRHCRAVVIVLGLEKTVSKEPESCQFIRSSYTRCMTLLSPSF